MCLSNHKNSHVTEQQNTNTATNQAINLILDSGLEGLAGAIAVLVDQAMLIERSNHLGAGPYERHADRDGHANGLKTKTLQTRVGKIELSVPQVRGSTEAFYPSAFVRGQRSEVALKIAVAEMYLQGVSTRRVTKVMGELCGFDVTSTEANRATAAHDEMFEAWRTRPIDGEISHVLTDAKYEKVRVAGEVRSCALLVAIGIRKKDGKRTILGCSVSLSEAEVHWREFFASLKTRGLGLPRIITSDAHEGLKAGLAACFPGVPWRRCQFHLQQNAQAYVPKTEMKAEVAASIRRVFDAQDRREAENRIAELLKTYTESAPKLAAWAEENLPEGLAVLALPEPLRKRLRTSNASENLNMQIGRRTRVCGLFPNEASRLRLATAILMEQSDEWETGKAYLKKELL
ncbi:MAG: putative transposase [Verrucomicrobiales bacterium]